MLGWGMFVAILMGGLVVLICTFMGGMWLVSLTDLIQFILMTLEIFFIMLPIGLASVDGWDGMTKALPDVYMRLDNIGYDTIIAFFLLFFLGLIIGQDIWQRVFTARDNKIARRDTIIAGIYCLLYATATAMIGMVATVKFVGLDDPQMAFATTAANIRPVGLTGLVLAGTLSA